MPSGTPITDDEHRAIGLRLAEEGKRRRDRPMTATEVEASWCTPEAIAKAEAANKRFQETQALLLRPLIDRCVKILKENGIDVPEDLK